MNTHQNPLHKLDRTASSKAIAAALHDYGAAWCASPEDRPPWTDDELDHDLPTLPTDDQTSPAYIVTLPGQDPDLIRRLGQAIRTPRTIEAAALDARASINTDVPMVIEVDFDNRPRPTAKPTPKRRRPPRVSTRLNADDVERLFTAYGRARLMGFEWTAFLTVAWATLGIVTDEQVSAATASLTNRLREWATRSKHVSGLPGIPIGWVWVHERGPLCGKLHTHFLLAVPRKKRAMLGRVVLD